MFMDELTEDSIKPLRVCRVCGKEAFNYEGLTIFTSDLTQPYGRQTICKQCKDKYTYFRKNPNKTEEDYLKVLKRREDLKEFNNSLKQDSILIKCKKCGITANTPAELSLFTTNSKTKLGVIAKCKVCDAQDSFLRQYPHLSLDEYLTKKEDKKLYLKKCIYCGEVANTEAELKKFAPDKDAPMGKANVCIKCRSIKSKEYYNRPDVKIKIKKNRQKYFKSEKGKLCIRKANRERKLKLRTRSYKEDISIIYEITNALNKIGNVLYEVDHIYPLNHPAMCGLHVKNNLQILESNINNEKNNRLGYLYQMNCSELAKMISSKSSREEVYSLIGCRLSYSEFLEYEKKHFKEYL